MSMTDLELRALCNRFFDAYENRLIDDIRDIYADNCVIWNNVFDSEMTGAENVAALPKGYSRQRRRTYNDRRINTFPGGFVIQYTLGGVHHSGHKGALWAAIVAQCHDGKITRIDEYLDSSKFKEWRGPNYEENLPDEPDASDEEES